MARLRGPVLAIALVCAAMAFTTGTATAAIIFGAPVDVTAGTDPREVAVADLVGDGDPDLAARTATPTCAPSWETGEGAFTAAVNDVAGDRHGDVEAGDLDGDDDLDPVVTANAANAVTCLSTTRSGVVAAPVASSVASSPFGRALPALNGDGHRDAVAVNDVRRRVVRPPGNGDGTFASAVSDTPAAGFSGTDGFTASRSRTGRPPRRRPSRSR